MSLLSTALVVLRLSLECGLSGSPAIPSSLTSTCSVLGQGLLSFPGPCLLILKHSLKYYHAQEISLAS